MPDHEQLPVRAARSGDSAAWNTLFQRFQLPLYSFVVELVRHEQAALDIVQESFTTAIRHVDSLRDDRRFGSWLFAIAHQRVVQHWRRESRTAHVFQETDAALESVADDAENPATDSCAKSVRPNSSRCSNACPSRNALSCSCILSKTFRSMKSRPSPTPTSVRSNPACITPRKRCANFGKIVHENTP